MRASVHVRRASSEREFGLLQEMVHQLLTPNVVSFNASINGQAVTRGRLRLTRAPLSPHRPSGSSTPGASGGGHPTPLMPPPGVGIRTSRPCGMPSPYPGPAFARSPQRLQRPGSCWWRAPHTLDYRTPLIAHRPSGSSAPGAAGGGHPLRQRSGKA